MWRDNHGIIFASKEVKEAREKELKLVSARYLTDGEPTPATTFIYADRVAIVIWGDEPMAFLIRSQKVSDSYRKHFEIEWKQALK